MPPKKRTRFGGNKSNSRRHIIHSSAVAQARNTESCEERYSRLQQDRTQHAATRNAETENERIRRLEDDSRRHSNIRNAETTAQQHERLAEDSRRHANVRDAETTIQRSQRLAEDNRRHANVRNAETTIQRSQRLAEDNRRHANVRDAETTIQRSQRLAEDNRRHANVRDAETAIQRSQRLAEDSRRHANARDSETTNQRFERLHADRRRHAAGREFQNANPSSRTLEADGIEGAAFNYHASTASSISNTFEIGGMTFLCVHCGALKWKGETAGMCCCHGKVRLPELQMPPEPLHSLFSCTTPTSRHFLGNIRKYNSAFQMTSFGSTNIVHEPGFMPTFKVQGQVYHRIGSLQPLQNEEHKFLQLYFMGDEQMEADQRCNNIPGTRKEIIVELQQFLHQHNRYIQSFKTAIDMMPTHEYRVVVHADRTPAGEHERRYNSPITNEVAVVIAGNEFGNRDIVLHKNNNEIQRVSETHRSYDALQYPLIFWQGEDGYNFSIYQVDPMSGTTINKKVSAMNFYAFRLMVRHQTVNTILRCRQLFHQFVVDMYAKIESERLLYVRLNQTKLRAENYIHLRDAINNDVNIHEVGQVVILPSTFTGSPRYMHEYTQDAMTYVRNYGRPDLFITFTCNPKWPEIHAELMDGQTYYDRHDLTARVFRQKLIQLLNAITKNNVFGQSRCWMYSIEWQKRGLPHAHILVWLKNKIMPSMIDNVISAEIPDPAQDPILFDVIVKHMIHGPCGVINPTSPCMKDGKCTKNYPRNLVQDTQTGMDGYPLYRRRSIQDGGQVVKVKIGYQSTEVDIDNKWIVPFCPLLCRIFQAHINVEYCNSVKSIKYICKYVNKGTDQAVFDLERSGTVNEIHHYQMGRYISSNEAVWRILDFPIHQRYPTVVHLSVHLENGQRVYFTEQNVRQKIMDPPKTTLTAFFLLCQQDDFAKTLLYCEVPKYYTWDSSRKVFNRRKQGVAVEGYEGIKATDALGRVYTVHPSNFECFFLRLLLHNVRGPTSFQAVRTVDGYVYNTYREACQRRGLLEDDAHWDSTMVEASTTNSPAKLRELFAILLTTCGLSDPLKMWDAHKENLAEDILIHAQRENPHLVITFSPSIFNEALIKIEDKVLQMVQKRIEQMGLPTPVRNCNSLCTEMLRETAYNVEELKKYICQNEPLLTEDQRVAYFSILHEVHEEKGAVFFLDAPGGTGKTFLINLLLAKVRERIKIAIAVASSGIAATLLTGGRTAHSCFKLPLNLARTENPICNITKGTEKAQILQECQLIVWDECTMSHKNALEALDRTLQDLRGHQSLMGGVVVVLAGDFRQTLPIIPKGTMADELKACLKSSYLWRHVRKLELMTNMRVHLYGNTADGNFAQNLLDIGNGLIPVQQISGLIKINFFNNVFSIAELKDRVFPNIHNHFTDHKWLCERAILAPKNESVNIINLQIQEQLPGDSSCYKSIDSVIDINETVHYPTEFLNSLELPGMPSHNLILKIGSPIILLRNLNPPKLCNGTRLIVKNLMPHVLEATILTGCAKGEDVFIPRIPLIPSDMPFQFKRLQFPVRLAFAMSINKAQGQSLKVAGVHLESPCFSHGQLYVACSRVGSKENLYIYAPNQETKNVVYQAALQ